MMASRLSISLTTLSSRHLAGVPKIWGRADGTANDISDDTTTNNDTMG